MYLSSYVPLCDINHPKSTTEMHSFITTLDIFRQFIIQKSPGGGMIPEIILLNVFLISHALKVKTLGIEYGYAINQSIICPHNCVHYNCHAN